MSDVAFLLRRARALAKARGIALTTVSKLLFADWRRLDAIATGNSFLRPPTMATALKRLTALESGVVRKRARDTAEAANARDA